MSISWNLLKSAVLLFFILFVVRPSMAQNKDSIFQLIPKTTDTKERIRLLYLIMGDSGDSDPEKALFWYKKLIELSRELKDQVSESVASVEMGYALYWSGNTTEGSALMLKATRLAEKTKNQQAIGIAYDNIYGLSQDPEKQKEVLFKALAASTAAKDYLFICWELNNLSEIYRQQNMPDSDLYYCQRQLQVALANNIEEALVYAYGDLGGYHYLRNEYPLALQYFQMAKLQRYVHTDAKAARFAYGSLCMYHREVGDLDSALYYAKLSYEAAKKGFYRIQMNAMGSLWKTYEKMKMGDSAFKYLKMEKIMKDSVDSKIKLEQIRSQVMIEEMRQQEIREERSRNLQYSAIALGVVLLLLLFFVFSFSIVANERFISFLGILLLLIVFEFLNLFLHPWLEKVTHHNAILMLAIMVGIAAMLIPLHHKLQHWMVNRLVKKNNAIRLKSARRTIEKLEKRD